MESTVEEDLKDTEFAFFSASINEHTIYVRVSGLIISDIVYTLIDAGYKIVKILEDVWDYNIETGESYEIATQEEVEQFINNNIRFRTNAKK